jgi:hypothetical protein
MTFEIETGIPMPDDRGSGMSGALRRLALDGKIGDSVFFPGKRTNDLNGVLGNLKIKAGWQVARTVDGGCRVWKVRETEPRS